MDFQHADKTATTCVAINRALYLSTSKSCRNTSEFSLRKVSLMADQHHHLTVLDDESEAETLRSPSAGSHVGGCARGFPMTFQQVKAVITNSFALTHKTRSYYFFSYPVWLHGSQYHMSEVPLPALLLHYPLVLEQIQVVGR